MDLSQLSLASRAELYLCLSRAFLPPLHPADRLALHDDLAQDLQDLHAELGFPEPSYMALRRALSELPEPTPLLAGYSRLFLAPPAPALLSLGFYLDGALLGGSCQQIEDLYRRWGLERDAQFRDTADHLALYLQFVAWIYARALDSATPAEGEPVEAGAEDPSSMFAELHKSLVQIVLPAMARLETQIRKAEAELQLFSLYGDLAAFTRHMLDQEATLLQNLLPKELANSLSLNSALNLNLKPGSRDAASLLAAASGPAVAAASAADVECGACGTRFAAAPELATMMAVLEAQGLATDHMKVCPDCRAGEMGLTPLQPPRIKKKGGVARAN